MSGEPVKTAAALVIGNEILSGKIQETNLFELAVTLRRIGIRLARVVFVPDDLPTIADELRQLSQRYDVVFTSGGVGPTHDDITLEAVAAAFGVEAKIHERIASLIRERYGESTNAAHLRMALVPEGAELVSNDEVRWPTVVMRNVWVLPGIPEIFRMKLALVRDALRGGQAILSRAVFLMLDEAEVKPLLDHVVARHTSVEVGSYPKWFDATYKTKITFDSQDPAALAASVEEFLSLLPTGEPQRVT